MPSRKEVVSELAREFDLRKKVYPAKIQAQELHAQHAQNQIGRLVAAMKVLNAMTDDEFANLLKRHEESKEGGAKQGALW